MAESKEAKATPKKSKDGVAKKSGGRKAAKGAASKLSNLSQEKVVDSDSDEEKFYTPEAKTASKSKVAEPSAQSTKAKASSSSSDESSDDEDTSDEEQKVIPKLTKPETIPAKVNGVKRKVEESDSLNEQSSSGEESEDEQLEHKKAKTTRTSESSSSEDEDEDTAAGKPGRGGAVNGEEPKTQSSIQSIPAPPFEPPTGYSSMQTSKSPAASPFTTSLMGKQIWHITAPSNVPVKTITEVALSSIQNAEPVLHHKGSGYVLARNNSHGAEFRRVLLPGLAGYNCIDQKVDEHFTIQQKLELPNLAKLQGTGSKAAADIATTSVSTIRAQPTGMKMRYKPPGFGRGDPGCIGSDSDDDESAVSKEKRNTAQFPRVLGVHGVLETPETQVSEAKKERKKRRQSEDVQMTDVHHPEINGTSSMPPPSSTTPRKKEKKRKESSETPDGSATLSSQQSSTSLTSIEKDKPNLESKEDRAKRKEAKRLKKEKKAKENGA